VAVPRPSDMFDREWEWSQLAGFVEDQQPGATLGIMSGRRRQGKTFLLEGIAEATGGFYFVATDELPAAEALHQLGVAIAAHRALPGALQFRDWEEAVAALLASSGDHAAPVILDEFPYLARRSPELPSVIQKALSPRSPSRRASKARLLLCGSSISFMGNLLAGGAPLRGRAALELVVPTFNFRQAAEFWQLTDHQLAAMVYCVVGGTPAYRTEYLRGATPSSVKAFDRWVVEHVLSPASPLFREVRALLAEDPALRDTGLYQTVLAAVAEGNATRGGIANRIERKAGDISHHLTVLEDAGLLVPEADAFRRNRSQYRITEPLVRFYHAIVRPHWTQLERVRPGRTERIWRGQRDTFRSQVAGPVFEHMCRIWTEDFADEETFGGYVTRARPGVVYDEIERTSYEVDVAATDADGRLLAIGEAKWNERIGPGHLARLERAAALLAKRDQAPRALVAFSGKGFAPSLEESARASGGRIQLVDLRRLYEGS